MDEIERRKETLRRYKASGQGLAPVRKGNGLDASASVSAAVHRLASRNSVVKPGS